jgi:hypothetical protein
MASAPLGPGRRGQGIATAVGRTLSARQGGQLTEAERAQKACFERRASGGVGGWLAWIVIEKAMATEPWHDSHLDVDRERFDIQTARCWQSPEVCARGALARGEHAVGHREVKMNIQVHAAAKSLREARRSACCWTKPGPPGALALRAEDLLHEDAPNRSSATILYSGVVSGSCRW